MSWVAISEAMGSYAQAAAERRLKSDGGTAELEKISTLLARPGARYVQRTWTCSYCGGQRPAAMERCSGCGASRQYGGGR